MFKKISLTVLCMFFVGHAQAIDLSKEPKLQAIADELISEKHYTQSQLDRIFEKARVQQSVLDAMTNPAEYKFTWGKYRKLFLKEDRIQQGVDFWIEHQAILEKAEQEYGVPASVIVSIVGVESKYGRYKGKHKVLDSLSTLVVGFPRRSKFFAKELKHFLILSKENQLEATEILGSYAGAVGFPQFISSSYRSYAVDYSGDGKTDLINQPVDAIGSIANYFIKNGWKPGEPVTSLAYETVEGSIADLANRKRKTIYTAQSLRDKGAPLASSISDDEKLNVLMLDANEVVNEPKNSNRYVVRAGDTACQIAKDLKVSCSTLISLNKLGKKGKIYRGQRLKVPNQKKSNTELASTPDSKWQVAKPNPIAIESDTVQERYFFTHRNFYAITQYNHSVLYAMAVHDLSQAIDQAKRAR